MGDYGEVEDDLLQVGVLGARKKEMREVVLVMKYFSRIQKEQLMLLLSLSLLDLGEGLSWMMGPGQTS